MGKTWQTVGMALRFLDYLGEANRRADEDCARQALVVAAMLDGGECVVLGRRVRLVPQWLDAPPMTDEQARGYAAVLRASAERTLAGGD